MSLPLFIYPDWPAPKNIKAYVSTRIGGFSQPPFNSLNVAKHVNDDELIVDKNRDLLPNHENITWLIQTHSTNCVNLDLPQPTTIEADASFSRNKNQVCGVMTADCLPLLLCDIKGEVVAAVHAGWRGLAAGIIENSIAAMKVNPADIMAWLGPAISQGNFEVGEDVKEAFLQYPQAFISSHASGKYLLDLYLIAKQKLANYGIDKVYGGNFCTYRQSDLFFSHRRATHELDSTDKMPVTTGRMVSAVYIE
ncbi:peptidoglycan editing factor PgeF [uncultured Paraglaciecola sp.]|uniref:peptidoglycan editing factor PgeF n=1 Tax=uncultured Paraglaciecola sp. TaxID=1765024 RepID=UPI0025949F6D|nr:peptidoglycan editing factor PgeF [uncultured Paraglaciecola sp.]